MTGRRGVQGGVSGRSCPSVNVLVEAAVYSNIDTRGVLDLDDSCYPMTGRPTM